MTKRTMNESLRDNIVKLTSAMVGIASRGGLDGCDNIIQHVCRWLDDHGLEYARLTDDGGRPSGLYLHIKGSQPGPSLCLDACLDTAPFGDEEVWSYPPLSGAIDRGRLYGRGAADSKVAAAIFANLAVQIVHGGGLARGELYMLFDADEHTGRFGGVRSFEKAVQSWPDAYIIGYPGNYGITIGARGFLRGDITTRGVSRHSGGRRSSAADNAIVKMGKVVSKLAETELPLEKDKYFSFGPSVNVTEIRGGGGFNQNPDRCQAKFDFRLTPNVSGDTAKQWLETVIRRVDAQWQSRGKTEIQYKDSWPAYRLDRNLKVVRVLEEAAEQEYGRKVPLVVCGPSNIGNYLAARHVPAICGFGVSYGNIHGVDEYIEIDSIEAVYRTYARAISQFFTNSKPE